MKQVRSSYFEQEEVWETHYRDNPAVRERNQEVIRAIPSEVATILDAGCGNGIFLNTLRASSESPPVRLAGVDLSTEALRAVQCEKYHCSITKMPFDNAEFDMVTCLEVLEHVNWAEYEATLAEIARVAGRFILVTVPNQEDLLQKLIICPQCFCSFSPWSHVRSFSDSDMVSLFYGFSLEVCRPIGPLEERVRYPAIVRGANLFWRRPQPLPFSICPQCLYRQSPNGCGGEQRTARGWRRILFESAKKAAGILSARRKQRKWLLALYRKTGVV